MSENKEPAVTETCRVIPVGWEKAAYKCGHIGPINATFDLYGQKYFCNQELLAGREKCPECLHDEQLKSVIRCCQCGFPILPGSGVIRYGDISSYKKEWTTVDGGGALGCLRVDCCDNPFAVSGNWNGQKVDNVYGGLVIGDELHGFDGGTGGFSD
jgi:hypothetical protein